MANSSASEDTTTLTSNTSKTSSKNNSNDTTDVIDATDDEEVKILVVDDERTARNVVKRLLEKMNPKFKVTTCEGGREALELLQRETFALMLLDVMMPEMDGYELMRLFKRASVQDMPTIMMSASDEQEIISKSFQSGAEDFLPKPIQNHMLKRRVEACLEQRRRLLMESKLKKQLAAAEDLGKRLAQEVREKESELERIKHQIAEQIETPIQVVMDTCKDILNSDSITSSQFKQALIAVMKTLGSSDLYKPSFAKIFEKPGGGEAIDETTRQWLMTEYTHERSDSVADASAEIKAAKEAQTPQPQQQQQPQIIMPSPRVEKVKAKKITIEEPSEEMKKQLRSFAFDPTIFKVEELMQFIMWMFKDLNLYELFDIDINRMWNFLTELRDRYHDNPYHNFHHAMDVTQFMYAALCNQKVSSLLRDLDKLALMVSALCHDVDHPGLNNNFQVQTQSDLAMLYNDNSVLENHHCSVAFSIIRESECAILSQLPAPVFKELRSLMIQIILATDMSKHFEIMTKFQARIATGPLNRDSKDDRIHILNYIMKCGDISNVCRPFNTAKKWAYQLIDEFLHQGDTERNKGIPISPLMDRDCLNIVKMQVDFIDFVAAPLFKNLVAAVPSLQELMDVIQKNREIWNQIHIEEDEQAKRFNVRYHVTASGNNLGNGSSSGTAINPPPTSASSSDDELSCANSSAAASPVVAEDNNACNKYNDDNNNDKTNVPNGHGAAINGVSAPTSSGAGSQESANFDAAATTTATNSKQNELSAESTQQQQQQPQPQLPAPTKTPGFYENEADSANEEQPVAADSKKIRILLVEDDDTCQKIANLMLVKSGYTVDLCDNGVSAVEMTEKNHYDLILMDCGLPQMDGYTATQMIRKNEEGTHRRTPIIAITAFGLEVAREKCLMSGMDLCLAKPIHKKQLLSVIQKWTESKDKRQVVPIDMQNALEQSSGDPEFLETLLHEFLAETRTHLETFNTCIQNQNWDVLEREAHSLKGAALTLAVHPLANAAFALEKSARRIKELKQQSGAAAVPPQLIDHLQPEVANVQRKYDDLREYLFANGVLDPQRTPTSPGGDNDDDDAPTTNGGSFGQTKGVTRE